MKRKTNVGRLGFMYMLGYGVGTEFEYRISAVYMTWAQVLHNSRIRVSKSVIPRPLLVNEGSSA